MTLMISDILRATRDYYTNNRERRFFRTAFFPEAASCALTLRIVLDFETDFCRMLP